MASHVTPPSQPVLTRTVCRILVACLLTVSEAALPAVTHVGYRELIEMTELSGLTISPDGRWVAFRGHKLSVSSNTANLEWYVMPIEGGKAVDLGSGGDPGWSPAGVFQTESPVWSQDSAAFYVRVARNQGHSLWRMYIDGRAEKLTGAEGLDGDIDSFCLDDTYHRIFLSLGPSSEALAAARAEELRSGVRLDDTVRPGAVLETNLPYGNGLGSVRWRQDGSPFVVGDSGKRRLFVHELRNGLTRESNASETHAYSTLCSTAVTSRVKASANGVTVEVTRGLNRTIDSETDDTPGRLIMARSSASEKTQCRDERCKDFTGEVVWRKNTSEFVFSTATFSGTTGMYAWDSDSHRVRTIYITPGVLNIESDHILSRMCPIIQRFAVCVFEAAAEPPSIVRIGLADGTLTQLYDPNAELRAVLRSYSVTATKWQDERGFVHTGILVELPRKQTTGRRPLVITGYRCTGFLRGGTGNTAPEYVLADAGFAVLCTNVQDWYSAPRYSEKSIPSGQATRLQFMIDGWAGAVTSLARDGLIDPDRVGISGLSFTGEVVQYALTHSTFASAATAGHLPATDPIDYYIWSGMGELGRLEVKGYGLEDPETTAGREYYTSVSPALNAKKVSAPLLVQTDEWEFPLGLQYYGALRRARKPVEVIVFPGESHLFWQPSHRALMQERNLDWFRYWLQNFKDDVPAKQEQYARWSHLDTRDIPVASKTR